MTVSTTDSVTEYTGNASTTTFPVPFVFLANADLVVTSTTADGNATTTLVQGTDYTVIGAGAQAGGAIITITPPAAGVTLAISRVLEAVQETDLRNQGRFLAETHEKVFDRLTMLIQQGFAGLSRALKRPLGKAYYDAEGRLISNVADPVSAQDAATKNWAQQYVGGLLAAGQGSVNAAKNVLYTGPDGIAYNLQDLANRIDPAKGAALIGYGGRTVYQAFRDRINVADYMLDSAGTVRTQTQAAQAAAADALAGGKALYFPAGTWTIAAAITGSGKPICVEGDGVRATRVVFSAATGGFDFTFTPQSNGVIPDQFAFRDMSIESNAAVTTPAVRATWSAYQPNSQGMAWIENLNITRKADGTGSFTAGISLNRCIGGFVGNVIIVGDDARAGLYGVQLNSCLEIDLTNVKVTRYQEGLRINKTDSAQTQTEGVLCTQCWFYDVNRGIYSPDQAIHINAVGCFFNNNGTGAANKAAIELASAAQCTIMGCLIYAGGNAGDGANQDGIRLTGGGGNTVAGNRFVGVTKANARYGIITAGGSSYNSLTDNDISAFSGTGIFVGVAADTGNRLVDNHFYDCTLNYTDSGTGSLKVGNMATPAAGSPVMIDGPKWGAASGGFSVGEISSNATWGGFIRGRTGTNADLALVDSGNVACLTAKSGAIGIVGYAKAALPPAVLRAGGCGLIYVTDATGGGIPCYSDGTNWRRVDTAAIVS